MSSYRDCPLCAQAVAALDAAGDTPDLGSGAWVLTESWDYAQPSCPCCGGTGLRPLSRAQIELALEAQEWADEQVASLFKAWSEISGFHHAYGVESWRLWGDELRITQDTSRRNCHNSCTHELPAAWLDLGPEALKTAMVERAAAERAAEERQERERIEREAAWAAQRLADLNAKLAKGAQ